MSSNLAIGEWHSHMDKLKKVAITNRDSNLRNRAINKILSRSSPQYCMGDIVCFGNHKDTRERAVNALLAGRTISALATLREAAIDTNFKDTKEYIISKLSTNRDHEAFCMSFDCETAKETIENIKKGRIWLNPDHPLFDHTLSYFIKGGTYKEGWVKSTDENRIDYSDLERELDKALKKYPMPKMTSSRKEELDGEIRTLERIFESGRDFRFASEVAITKARIIRHDINEYAESLIPWGDREQLKICMVRSLDEKKQIQIFDRLVLYDSYNSDFPFYRYSPPGRVESNKTVPERVEEIASYGFKHCRVDHKMLAEYMFDYAKKYGSIASIVDAAKYSKRAEIRGRAFDYLVGYHNRSPENEAYASELFASIASEASALIAIDSFVACVFSFMKEREGSPLYKVKLRAVNSAIKRPSPILNDWFFPWLMDCYGKRIDRPFDFRKCSKMNSPIRKKIFLVLISVLGIDRVSRSIKWHGMISTWIHTFKLKEARHIPEYITDGLAIKRTDGIPLTLVEFLRWWNKKR